TPDETLPCSPHPTCPTARIAARIVAASSADNWPSITAAVSASKLRSSTAALRKLGSTFVNRVSLRNNSLWHKFLSRLSKSKIAKYPPPHPDLRGRYRPDRL